MMETISQTSLSGFVYASVTFLAIWYIGYLFHNVYFHPLSKFPGPRLAGATRWYETFFDLFVGPGGQYIFEIDRMHEEYGPIVRIGPNEVHVKDFQFGAVLYARGQKRDKVPFMAHISGFRAAAFATIEHDLHRLRRSAISPYFSLQAVRNLEPLIQNKTGQLCNAVITYGRDGRCLSVRHALTACVVDIVTEYSFGTSTDALSDQDFSPDWRDMIHGMTESVPLARSFPIVVPLIQSLPRAILHILNPLMAKFSEFETILRGNIQHSYDLYNTGNLDVNKSPDEGTPTIFHQILASSLPESEKTVERMAQEAFTLIGAAADTTTSIVTAIVFFLASEPSLAAQLRAELETAVPKSTSIPSWKDLQQLPYLLTKKNAVIKEGLRIYPGVASRLPLSAPNDLKYQEQIIPAGSYIGMSIKHSLHDEDTYARPLEFIPDRWLNATPEKAKQMDAAFVPFNRGPRQCMGMNLAYAIIYHLVYSLHRNFKFELVDTTRERDIDVARDHFAPKQCTSSRGVIVRVAEEY